jgi:hypothetical protein
VRLHVFLCVSVPLTVVTEQTDRQMDLR